MAMLLSEEVISNAMTCIALLIALGLLLLKRHMEQTKAPACVKAFHQMPTPTGANFILGHLLLINPLKIHLVFIRWANDLGGIYRFRMLHENIVVVTDPKLFSPILGAGDDALPKHRLYTDFKDIADIRGTTGGEDASGVFTMLDFHDDKFKIVRKELALAFSMKQMKEEAVPNLMSIGQSLAAKWGAGQGQSLLVNHVLEVALLDFNLHTSFKFSMSAAERDELLERLSPALDELRQRVANPLRSKLQLLLPFLPSSRKVQKVMQGAHQMFKKVWELIQANAPYETSDMSFSACLWRIETVHGLKANAAANVVEMVIAGFETSAGAISWALYDIASIPEVQSKLHAELKSAGLLQSDGKKGRPIAWEDLSLPYLNAVIKESARINPVASDGTFRETVKETIIGGYCVPKGAMVVVPMGAVQTSIHNWDNPFSFKPDRFLPGGKGTDNPAYLPFSIGPRNCVGQNMAYVTVRVILLELLSSLRFEVDPRMGNREDVLTNQVMSLTMKHDGGIHLISHRL